MTQKDDFWQKVHEARARHEARERRRADPSWPWVVYGAVLGILLSYTGWPW